MSWWLISYVVTVITAMVIATVHNVFCLDAGEWASWVQAVGSIAAILGAYALAVMQEKNQAANAAKEERQALEKLELSAMILVRGAKTAVNEAAKSIRGHHGDAVFHHATGSLEDAQYSLRTLLGRPLNAETLSRVLLLQREVTYFLRLLEQLDGSAGPFSEDVLREVQQRDAQAFIHSFQISDLANREYNDVWMDLVRKGLLAEV